MALNHNVKKVGGLSECLSRSATITRIKYEIIREIPFLRKSTLRIESEMKHDYSSTQWQADDRAGRGDRVTPGLRTAALARGGRTAQGIAQLLFQSHHALKLFAHQQNDKSFKDRVQISMKDK